MTDAELTVSVDAVDFFQRLSDIEDDEISILKVYNAMLDATQIHTHPCTISAIVQQWLTIKSVSSNTMLHELVDTCIACLLWSRLRRIQRRGAGGVTDSMVESVRECVQTHWARAVEIPDDPSSVMEIEELVY